MKKTNLSLEEFFGEELFEQFLENAKPENQDWIYSGIETEPIEQIVENYYPTLWIGNAFNIDASKIQFIKDYAESWKTIVESKQFLFYSLYKK